VRVKVLSRRLSCRLLTMSDVRLPRRVSQARWPGRAGKGSQRMHAEVVAAVERAVGISTAEHRRQGASKAVFKGAANAAVRKHDMATIRRSRKSTVVRYLTLLPQPAEFPTQPAGYLAGPVTLGQKALLLARAGALLPRGCSEVGPCPGCGAAAALTLPHALLECSAWGEPRSGLWQSVTEVVGAAAVQRVRALPPAGQVAALLSTPGWAGCAGLVSARVQRFLADVCASFRVPRWTAQAALGSVADVACQVCHSRGREASLLLCDGCRRGYHQRCLTPVLPAVPAGQWFCPGCVDTGGCPPSRHVPRRRRRVGPWPSG
jgi:hypothetical protein